MGELEGHITEGPENDPGEVCVMHIYKPVGLLARAMDRVLRILRNDTYGKSELDAAMSGLCDRETYCDALDTVVALKYVELLIGRSSRDNSYCLTEKGYRAVGYRQ